MPMTSLPSRNERPEIFHREVGRSGVVRDFLVFQAEGDVRRLIRCRPAPSVSTPPILGSQSSRSPCEIRNHASLATTLGSCEAAPRSFLRE
jgi:UDP:flavonoid glycosyltransferase YjiC (YdhE family)